MNRSNGPPVANILALTAGIGVGAGLMYFFDPARGRRRRRKLIDQASSLVQHDARALQKKGGYLLNRMHGVAAEAAAAFTEAEPVNDETLVARVRSRMGHVLADPHVIEVLADNGVITLKGKLGHAERRALKDHIRATPGVKAVHDHLEPRSVFAPGLLLGIAAGLATLAKRPAPVSAGPDQGC